MGDSRIKDVSSLLSAFFDEEKLRRGERYSDFFSSWSALVGAKLAAHSRIVDVDKGLLVIEADHPGWIQLLQIRQSTILEAVARRFPEFSLRGVIFRTTGQGVMPKPRSADADRPVPESQEDAEAVSSEGEGDLSEEEIPQTQKDIDPALLALFDSLRKAMNGKAKS
jgi:hypothetical protein